MELASSGAGAASGGVGICLCDGFRIWELQALAYCPATEIAKDVTQTDRILNMSVLQRFNVFNRPVSFTFLDLAGSFCVQPSPA